jgi:aspartate oxidase
MGIVRDGASLEKAMLELDGISNEGDVHYESFAKAFLASALARKESRGAHYRSDFPKPSEESQKQTIVKYGGEIKVGLK